METPTQKLIENGQPGSLRSGNLVGPPIFNPMTTQQLIEKLKTLPPDKSVLCQVVGQDDGAWNMGFDVADVPTSWMVVLTVSHPTLKTLPDWPNTQDDTRSSNNP